MKLQKRILTFAAAAMLALSMALPCAAAESAMNTLCAPLFQGTVGGSTIPGWLCRIRCCQQCGAFHRSR